MSRYRIGKQKNKKKIGNTRKLRGGGKGNITQMFTAYSKEVELILSIPPEESQIKFSIYMAQVRAYIEVALLTNTINFARIVLEDIKVQIPNYNTKINQSLYDKGKNIPKKLEVAIFNYDMKKLSNILTMEKDIYEGINKYIPDIVTNLNSLYSFLSELNISKESINEINVTPNDIGQKEYDGLIAAKDNKSQKNVAQHFELTDPIEKRLGIYGIRVWLNNKTYAAFENRLKLLHSLKIYEHYYNGILDSMNHLKDSEVTETLWNTLHTNEVLPPPPPPPFNSSDGRRSDGRRAAGRFEPQQEGITELKQKVRPQPSVLLPKSNVKQAYTWLSPGKNPTISSILKEEVEKIDITNRNHISMILKNSRYTTKGVDNIAVQDAEKELAKMSSNEQRIKNVIDAVKESIKSKNVRVENTKFVISDIDSAFAINVLTAAKGNISTAIYALLHVNSENA